MVQSEKFKLNKEDMKKIAIGAGVAIAGAVLTYITEVIPNVDFGSYTPVVVALFSILANAVRKLIVGK